MINFYQIGDQINSNSNSWNNFRCTAMQRIWSSIFDFFSSGISASKPSDSVKYSYNTPIVELFPWCLVCLSQCRIRERPFDSWIDGVHQLFHGMGKWEEFWHHHHESFSSKTKYLKHSEEFYSTVQGFALEAFSYPITFYWTLEYSDNSFVYWLLNKVQSANKLSFWMLRCQFTTNISWYWFY